MSLEKGVASLKVKEKAGVDITALKQKVVESGFTLRSINIKARGYLSKWEDPVLKRESIVFNLQNSKQRLLLLEKPGAKKSRLSALLNTKGIWKKSVTIKGELYEHKMEKLRKKTSAGSFCI